VLCHSVPALFIVPATGAPPDSADTWVSFPWAAVTMMPWPGWAALFPLAGVMASQESAAGLADDPWPEPPDALDPPPLEQAAVSSPAAAQIAIAALVERFLDGSFLSTGDLSVRGAA
jgi:hypothetical protein